MERFAVLMMLGWRVRLVRRLREGSICYHRRKLLLVDDSLSPEDQDRIAEHYLPDALDDEDRTP